jgi:hypothetical protein
VIKAAAAFANSWESTIANMLHVIQSILEIRSGLITPLPVPAAILAAYVTVDKFDELMCFDEEGLCEKDGLGFLEMNGLGYESVRAYTSLLHGLWQLNTISSGRAWERAHFAIYRARCVILAIAGFPTYLFSGTGMENGALLNTDLVNAADALVELARNGFVADVPILHTQANIVHATIDLLDSYGERLDTPSAFKRLSPAAKLLCGYPSPCLVRPDFASCPVHLYALMSESPVVPVTMSAYDAAELLMRPLCQDEQLVAAVESILGRLSRDPPGVLPACRDWIRRCVHHRF